MSLNGCTFVSGGGTPEDASKAELMALLFVTGRDGIYASLSKPFAGWGGVGVVGSQAGGTRCLVSPSTKKKKACQAVFPFDRLGFPAWCHIPWSFQEA